MLPTDHPAAPGRDASDRRRRRRPAALVATLVGLALLLAGCLAPKNQTTVESPRAHASGSAGPLAAFYDQALEWRSCHQGECATAQVPLDYADPSAGSIDLALARSTASGGDPLGSLLLNPGGPGASGIDFLEQAKGMISDDVQERYDLVAFDPRGVQRSNPVHCVSDAELDRLIAFDPDYSTDAGIQHVIDVYGDYGNACKKNTGAALGHIDTVSAARDLDVLRSALGDDQLHYLGFSYGTELGATYAALFPTTVGRMVLDGALPPTLTSAELAEGQAAGFEGALRAYVADCQKGRSCPLTGTVDDGMSQVRRLLDRARANPLPTTSDRDLTASLAFYGIALPLYSQDSWTYLTQALDAAIRKGDGSGLLQLADIYSDREADGTYSTNSLDAFNAINCVDTPHDAQPDFEAMRAEAAQINTVAPTVGSFFGFGDTVCAKWPVPAIDPLPDYSAPGAPPIVVVGTTNDPATPYTWAEKLADLLSTGVLLTYEGEGHTAYGSSNDCIADAVDTYLLGGDAPAAGTRC
ncbi:alpha/beta hydrolase [Cellulomonas sp. URHD0024]|uniref:alpha/beta hydrolase n=1 Tax=Cellulomonas sp. URHD0024 TaxID=1302620 RepID=UPI000422307F|nr:alpha/beta hydrolase [Cellulomonas sp. URHD0024]